MKEEIDFFLKGKKSVIFIKIGQNNGKIKKCSNVIYLLFCIFHDCMKFHKKKLINKRVSLKTKNYPTYPLHQKNNRKKNKSVSLIFSLFLYLFCASSDVFCSAIQIEGFLLNSVIFIKIGRFLAKTAFKDDIYIYFF